MIDIKTDKEIQVMQKGGKILHDTVNILLDRACAGVSLQKLDQTAEEQILAHGAKPSFKMVKGYNWTICACVNDAVVHGIPNDYILQNGDVIGIDCGVYLDGFHTDHAWTKKIENREWKMENGKDEVDNFLQVGEEALKKAISQVKPGNYIYDISKAIQETIEGANFSVVRTLVGHGVGRKLHEEPEVPGYVKTAREKTVKLIPGMVLAVEVIYNLGSPDVVYKGNDGWTIAAKDGKISGLFENTVAITSRGGVVLT